MKKVDPNGANREPNSIKKGTKTPLKTTPKKHPKNIKKTPPRTPPESAATHQMFLRGQPG
jgi:hypothetical protein